MLLYRRDPSTFWECETELQEKGKILSKPIYPEIEFSSEPTQIKKKGSVVLKWNAKEAEETILWKNTVVSPAHVDWLQISQLGEKVRPQNEIKLALEQTTAFYLAARNHRGWSAKRIVVELKEKKAQPKGEMWDRNLPERFAKRMEKKSDGEPTPVIVAQIGTHQIEQAFKHIREPRMVPLSGGLPPLINMSVSSEVIFQDESSTISWDIKNADVSSLSIGGYETVLIPNGDSSGVKHNGGGYLSSGYPPVQGDWNGSEKINGTFFKTYQEFYVGISSIGGGVTSTADVWMDRLYTPNFGGNGSTPSRIKEIRDALRDIDKRLHYGCIYWDTYLDTTLPAFKNKHLNRIDFYTLLRDVVLNISIVTFNCQDLPDSDYGPPPKHGTGDFADYDSQVHLNWFPSHTPNVLYVVLHELIHKCGFNIDLMMKGNYTHDQIEDMAFYVGDVCFGYPAQLDPQLWP